MANVTFSNPPGVPLPAARYSQAGLVEGGGRRLIISGQIGVLPDGTVLESPEEQVRQTLRNLAAVLAAHGMRPENVVKLTVLLTDRALLPVWRAERDVVFGGHAPCSTLMIVAGLADPRFAVEVEAEAID